MRICRASHIWQLPINKSMAGSAGSHSSSIWKYMMMVLHPVIFYNGVHARSGLMLASTHSWNSAGVRGSWEVCIAGERHRVTTQCHVWQRCSGGGGLNALKHVDQRFFIRVHAHASGWIFAGIYNYKNYKTKTSRTRQVTWIGSSSNMIRDGKLIYSCDV